MIKRTGMILTLLAVASATMWNCSGGDDQAAAAAAMANAARPYPVVEVEERTITGYTEYPANIQGKNNKDVRAKIQGYITQVLVDEGQYVQKGQPLFRLETNALTETASAARSGIGAAQAAVSAAQAAVKAAQVEVNKIKPLVEKGIVSAVQLETANANLMSAKAQLQQAQAQQAQANANYKNAQANVDYSVIRATVSGVVGKINFREGSLVGPTDVTPLTNVSDTSELFVYFSMNEKEYLNFLKNSYGATLPEKLKNLPSVELVLANGDTYVEKGRVQTVTGQIDATTGSIQFRVLFNNASRLLSNGNSGKVRLPKVYDKATIIPESTTFEQQGLIYTYKVGEDNKVKTNRITVLDRVDNMVIVGEGLKKGDKIVGQGVSSLRPDTEIIPQKVSLDSLVQAVKPIF